MPFIIQELKKLDLTKDKQLDIGEVKKKRSIPANSVYYGWIPAISDFTCTNIREARNVLKLDFGLPIILADTKIGQRYGERLEKLNFFNLTREELIGHIDDDNIWQNGIMEMIQVTSLMNTSQHNQMRDSILYFYNQAGLNIGY